MLIIRKAQMQAFGRAAEEELLRRLAADLGARFPEPCAALGAHLDDLVRFALAAARASGLRSERGLACYAQLVLLLGVDFADGGEPAAILGDRALDERAKMAALLAYCARV